MERGNLLRVDGCEYYGQVNIDQCLCKDSHALQAGQISGLAYLTFVSWTLLSIWSLQPVHDLYRTHGLASCVAFGGPSCAHWPAGKQHWLAAGPLKVLSITLSAETPEEPIAPRHNPPQGRGSGSRIRELWGRSCSQVSLNKVFRCSLSTDFPAAFIWRWKTVPSAGYFW